MSILDDFFGPGDRRTELGNKLIESLEKRHGFHGAREILHGGDTGQMTEQEQKWYTEWKPLDDERKLPRAPQPDYSSPTLPDFSRDTAAPGMDE